MSNDQDLAIQAIQRIAEIWQVDKAKCVWSVQSEVDCGGFDWWPGDFCVRVRANRSSYQRNAHTFRLTIRTDFLKDVPITDERFISLAAVTSYFSASTYAWVYPPASIFEMIGNWGRDVPTLWFNSSAYISSENIHWLPDFLARAAIMQPINAQIQAYAKPEMLAGGIPDVSRPKTLKDAGLDEMLEVAERVYAPLGEQPCQWAGSVEFESFAEKWAKSDFCFGFGDPTGMAIETPFGSDSALIKFSTGEKHVQLGHGLLATFQLPLSENKIATANMAAELNYHETLTWTNFPQLGCWHSHQSGGDQQGLAFSSFIPNALHQPGLATEVAFWFLQRARWVRENRWPDLVDQTMLEILKKRHRL